MAEFVFNSQVTVNGKIRERGDAVLVGWRSLVRTGHINTIVEQINAPGNYYFTVNVMMGGGNNPLPGKPPVEAVDSGFYHLDDPHPTGNRLVFPDEGDAAAERLNNLMQGRSDVATTPPVEEGNSGVDTGTPGAKPPSNTQSGQPPIVVAPNQSEQEFDPRDTNRDHIVDKAEKKAAKKEAQEKEGN